MGTRAGDIDPAIPLHMANQLGISTKEIDSMLNKKSGAWSMGGGLGPAGGVIQWGGAWDLRAVRVLSHDHVTPVDVVSP